MPPINLHEYQRLAQDRLPQMVYDYFAGGAADEITLVENHRAFDEIFLRPRVLRGVGQRDTSLTLFGQTLSMPIVIAPMAFQRLAHPDGELATARAAQSAGTVYTMSTLATHALEDIASQVSGPRWFQLYVYRDREVTRSLVARAEAHGFSAVQVTVDTPVQGLRESDIRNQFHLPPDVAIKNLERSLHQAMPEVQGESGLAQYIHRLLDDNLAWQDLDWLCSITKLPVLVKGIVRGDDAHTALEHGAAGIVVSNHGGRQLDTATATIRAVSEVAEALDGNGVLLVDGGIRRGTDVVKALALGADAVQLGRPILWGLAVAGEQGVKHVLELIHAEFSTAMALCGCRTLADLGPDLLVE